MTSRVLRERTVLESSYFHTTIKQWPAGERPREKLLSHGAASLTEAELLAILLRSGSRGVTAVDLAKKLLSENCTLRDLARLSVPDLRQRGIGTARAASIVAAFELARRLPASNGVDRPLFHDLRVYQHEEDVGYPLNHQSGPAYGIALDNTLLYNYKLIQEKNQIIGGRKLIAPKYAQPFRRPKRRG